MYVTLSYQFNENIVIQSWRGHAVIHIHSDFSLYYYEFHFISLVCHFQKDSCGIPIQENVKKKKNTILFNYFWYKICTYSKF